MATPSNSVKGEKFFIKAMSIILALIITIIFLTLLPYSLNEIFGTWIKIDGQLVNNPKCVNIPETDLFRCSPIEIHYKLPNNSKIYKKEDDLGIISETEYKKGDIIDIWHEKNSDPAVASFINQTPFLTGESTLIIMILFLILSWGWVYITHTF
tara:strand:- start:4342 stop:4803 length:462 start_codon:yes stop_codon:yes gene_type:complete